MWRLASRRILLAIPLLLVVSFVMFVLVSLMPGNPASILAGSNPQIAPYIAGALHLNESLPSRYVHWLAGAVHGNFGISWYGLAQGIHEPALRLILQRAPVTLSMAGLAMLISLSLAFVLGMASATRPNGAVSRFTTIFTALSIASPGFWVAYMLILVFAVNLHWLPAFSYLPPSQGLWPWFSHILLPAITLALVPTAALTLQLRSSLIEVLGRDYILSARAKGLSPRAILWKHALKNALVALVTVLGFQLAGLLGATAIVESVFSIPGIGQLAVQSALSRDIPVLLGLLVLTTLLVIVVNTLMDLVYAYLNPRVRTGSR